MESSSESFRVMRNEKKKIGKNGYTTLARDKSTSSVGIRSACPTVSQRLPRNANVDNARQLHTKNNEKIFYT